MPTHVSCPHRRFLPIVLSLAWAAPAKAQESHERFPPLRIVESTQYYPVHAKTEVELPAALKAPPARSGHPGGSGHTEGDIEVAHETRQDGALCRLERAEVTVTTVVTLPKWNPGDPPQEIRARWAQMVAGLERHELGHRRLIVEEAHRLRGRLMDIAPARSCREVSWSVRRELSRAMLRLRLRNQAYDSRTGSGRTQGAVF